MGFLEEVNQIKQYTISNDVESLFATYTLSYNTEKTELTLTVTDAEGVTTGHFVLYYEEDGLLAGVESYTADDTLNWDYNYSYDELKNRVSEVKLIELDDIEVPEVINSFDIESLLGDLSRYMPGYYDDLKRAVNELM